MPGAGAIVSAGDRVGAGPSIGAADGRATCKIRKLHLLHFWSVHLYLRKTVLSLSEKISSRILWFCEYYFFVRFLVS